MKRVANARLKWGQKTGPLIHLIERASLAIDATHEVESHSAASDFCHEASSSSLVSTHLHSLIVVPYCCGEAKGMTLHRTEEDVRRRLLNKLGIESKRQGNSDGEIDFSKEVDSDVACEITTSSSEDSLMDWVHPRNKDLLIKDEPLKYDKQAEESRHADFKRRKTTANPDSSQSKKKSCMFKETVQVIPIPMRHEYSNRVKARMWSNSMEIQENATRNTIEFASEGWDWRSVKLDDSMYLCNATGELIHPVHYEPSSIFPQQESSAAPPHRHDGCIS